MLHPTCWKQAMECVPGVPGILQDSALQDTVVGWHQGRFNVERRLLLCGFDGRIVFSVGDMRGNSSPVYSSVPLFARSVPHCAPDRELNPFL